MTNPIVFSEEEVSKLQQVSLSKLSKITELKNLEQFRKEYLSSKTSIVPQLISWVAKLTTRADKVKFGRIANQWRQTLQTQTNLLEERLNAVREVNPPTFNTELASKKIKVGTLHPIRKMINSIYDFFISQGYQIYETSEIESATYNFDKLNMDADHPARSSKDTFYLPGTEQLLLRTHTSNFQGRVLEANPNQELKVVSAGRVYRRDDDDATHSHQYTNLDILVVGRDIGITDLKGTLESLFKTIFNDRVKVRLRPSFFPFTEPSIEVDCSCVVCNGAGCAICKQTGWIEILGAGLVHPNVLSNSGYDSQRFSGFACGMGIERIVMIKYGIHDIRDFYLNDLRFIGQTKWK